MRSCRTASLFAIGALVGASAIASSCQDRAQPPDVPSLTTARPDGASLLGATTATIESDAAAGTALDDASAMLAAPLTKEPPIKASFVDVPGTIEAPICSRLLVAVAKGKVTALGEVLAPGDVLVVTHPDPIKLDGAGLVVVARREFDPEICSVTARPALDKKIIRAAAAPRLEWAGGTMSAHLDVAPPSKPDAGAGLSPDLYLGRLEGTAGVPDHNHPGSWEILAAVEANGTFVLEGTEGKLGARQIVMVPPGARHAWKPELGSRLVAIQMYSPPGPEQRFVGLAAAEKGVKDAGPK